jgi:hypothetical protein
VFVETINTPLNDELQQTIIIYISQESPIHRLGHHLINTKPSISTTLFKHLHVHPYNRNNGQSPSSYAARRSFLRRGIPTAHGVGSRIERETLQVGQACRRATTQGTSRPCQPPKHRPATPRIQCCRPIRRYLRQRPTPFQGTCGRRPKRAMSRIKRSG